MNARRGLPPPNPLDPAVVQWLARGPGFPAGAIRLWRRASRLLAMNVFAGPVDLPAIELSCHAWHFPLEAPCPSIRQRSTEVVVALTRHYPPACDQGLVGRAVRLLDELPERSPKLPEARIMADVVNLDELGISGLLLDATKLTRVDVLDRLIARETHREAYGYWPARLKTGFHFEASRRLAADRIEQARTVLRLLQTECELAVEQLVP